MKYRLPDNYDTSVNEALNAGFTIEDATSAYLKRGDRLGGLAFINAVEESYLRAKYDIDRGYIDYQYKDDYGRTINYKANLYTYAFMSTKGKGHMFENLREAEDFIIAQNIPVKNHDLEFDLTYAIANRCHALTKQERAKNGKQQEHSTV